MPEQTLFPGLTVVLLALACLALGGVLAAAQMGLWPRPCCCSRGSRSASTKGSFPWPYELVYHHLPGWQSSRTPSRLNTLTSLGLALLAAGGAALVAVARYGARACARRSASA